MDKSTDENKKNFKTGESGNDVIFGSGIATKRHFTIKRNTETETKIQWSTSISETSIAIKTRGFKVIRSCW